MGSRLHTTLSYKDLCFGIFIPNSHTKST